MVDPRRVNTPEDFVELAHDLRRRMPTHEAWDSLFQHLYMSDLTGQQRADGIAKLTLEEVPPDHYMNGSACPLYWFWLVRCRAPSIDATRFWLASYYVGTARLYSTQAWLCEELDERPAFVDIRPLDQPNHLWHHLPQTTPSRAWQAYQGRHRPLVVYTGDLTDTRARAYVLGWLRAGIFGTPLALYEHAEATI